MSECAHPLLFNGLCVACGTNIHDEIVYQHKELDYRQHRDNVNDRLLYSGQAAENQEESAITTLISSQKLYIVLDLDNTLLHATADYPVVNYFAEQGTPIASGSPQDGWQHLDQVAPDLFRFQLVGFQGWHMVKLRPGLRVFLQQLAVRFTLHIYTLGTAAYASAISYILDPDKKLFGSYVFSKDTFPGFAGKNLRWLFPCSDSMALVVDDRVDVWQDFTHNLLPIQPYLFWETPQPAAKPDAAVSQAALAAVTSPNAFVIVCILAADKLLLHFSSVTLRALVGTCRALRSCVKPYLQERMPAMNPRNDTALRVLEDVLNKLHADFYACENPRSADVKLLLPRYRHFLSGCVIMFTGVIDHRQWKDVTRHPLWLLAEQLGAKCQTDLNAAVTHVIAASATAKAQQASHERRAFIVQVEWLAGSLAAWRRLPEDEFFLKDAHQPSTARTKRSRTDTDT
eukprot:TRINITY_DN10879_c0_g1_i1.p1 TRINITY_DN10879_c0_g1~~TRINITY_DN10879_c0_g1_i1.p1  ORF type:complete len:457 (+),score=80.82 TRINITY_DN10879_c0_g1_i1:3-1373(+)